VPVLPVRSVRFVCVAAVLLTACGGGGGDPPSDDAPPDPDAAAGPDPDAAEASPDAATGPVTFTGHEIDGAADGPGYVAVGNLDADPALEVVVSHLGKSGFPPQGKLSIYDRGGDLDTWTVTDVDDVVFPGQTTLADLDGDADLDIILPSGFLVCAISGSPCGALGWYEHTASGWTRHDLVTGSALFYHHAVLVDVDGDGTQDLITAGEESNPIGGTSSAVTQWFRGTSSGVRFETTPREIGLGGGSFPRVLDVDGDGDLDIASAEFFHPGGSFAWFERTADPSGGNPAGTWVRHVLHGDSGPSIMLTPVEDLYGDGVRRYVGSNHTNTAKTPPDPWESAIFVFTPGAPITQPWSRVQISEGIVSRPGSMFAPQAAPGIFGVGDMDDDGDLDLVVSGDGDPRILWLEQTGAGQFETRVFAEPMGQAGGVTIVDLDGDGDHETIVTAYEENVVRVYSHDGGAP
jgi:hypothetical protein